MVNAALPLAHDSHDVDLTPQFLSQGLNQDNLCDVNDRGGGSGISGRVEPREMFFFS